MIALSLLFKSINVLVNDTVKLICIVVKSWGALIQGRVVPTLGWGDKHKPKEEKWHRGSVEVPWAEGWLKCVEEDDI